MRQRDYVPWQTMCYASAVPEMWRLRGLATHDRNLALNMY